jgi:hypothetical protein
VYSDDDAMSADGADRNDLPAEEPEGFTQQDQLKALREEGEEGGHVDRWFDMTEEEEARLLEAELGPLTEQGTYYASEESEGGEEP